AGGDHQVHVEHLFGVRAQRLHHVGTDGDIGHEVPVHHVDMHPVGAGGVERAHLLAELGEVGGQDRRGDDERMAHLTNYVDFAIVLSVSSGLPTAQSICQ